MFRFFLVLTGVLAVLLGAVWLGSGQQWWQLPESWIQVIVFTFFVTLIIGFNLLRIRKTQPQVFAQFYLLSISLKMVAGLAFIFFLVWNNPAEAGPTVALFMGAYVLFTGAEVAFLLKGQSGRQDQ